MSLPFQVGIPGLGLGTQPQMGGPGIFYIMSPIFNILQMLIQQRLNMLLYKQYMDMVKEYYQTMIQIMRDLVNNLVSAIR